MCTRMLLMVSCFLLAACNDGDSSPETGLALVPPDPVAATAIPNLSDGPHLGYIVGFDALNDQQSANASIRLAETVSSGMRVSRAQLGWDELEPAPGEFDQNLLRSVLDDVTTADRQPFFSLTTLDTGVLTIPSDLRSSDGLAPAAGLTLDGAEIEARLQAFLNWLLPELDAYNTWGLSIANESSTLFDTIAQQEVSDFLVSGLAHANTLTDQIAVTVTIAGGADSNPDVERFINDLMPFLDIASFNFYCLDSNTLQVTNQDAWQGAVNTFLARAQNLPIVFHELGCPAGWTDLGGNAVTPPASINATPAIQADFFRYMFEQIQRQDRLRAAIVFQLYDWSPELAESFSDSLVGSATGSDDNLVAARLEEWLATIGLCRWSDGTCREAYEVFVSAIAEMATIRNE